MQTTRWRILELLRKLAPGSRIPGETLLADKLGVSRTTVRSALDSLVHQGLVAHEGRNRTLLRRVQKSELNEGVEMPKPKDFVAEKFLLELATSGKLKAGEFVSERTVAAQLGFSIAPVREAFLALAPLKLFVKENRQQWKFAEWSEERLRELIEFRELLEEFCLGHFFQHGCPLELRRRLEQQLAETRKLRAAKRLSVSSFIEADRAFHTWILECGGNSLLIEQSRFIYTLLDLQYQNPSFDAERARFALTQHEAIMTAVLADDPKKSRQLLALHFESALETLLVLKTSKSPRHSHPATN